MEKRFTVYVVLALLLGACGGQAVEDPEVQSTARQEQPEPTSTTVSAEAPTSQVASQPAEGDGTVTIGSQTWTFALNGNASEICMPNTGGSFFVNMFGEADDGTQIALSIQTLGDGNAIVQAGAVQITGELWKADSNVYDTVANVEGLPEGIGAEVSVEGKSISGTGVFYEDRALAEARAGGSNYDAGVLEGTFSATCPDG